MGGEERIGHGERRSRDCCARAAQARSGQRQTSIYARSTTNVSAGTSSGKPSARPSRRGAPGPWVTSAPLRLRPSRGPLFRALQRRLSSAMPWSEADTSTSPSRPWTRPAAGPAGRRPAARRRARARLRPASAVRQVEVDPVEACPVEELPVEGAATRSCAASGRRARCRRPASSLALGPRRRRGPSATSALRSRKKGVAGVFDVRERAVGRVAALGPGRRGEPEPEARAARADEHTRRDVERAAVPRLARCGTPLKTPTATWRRSRAHPTPAPASRRGESAVGKARWRSASRSRIGA